MGKYKYSWVPGDSVSIELLEECSELYSNHYGTWSEHSSINPGKKIQLTPKNIEKWLKGEGISLSQARFEGELIGYAIAIRKKLKYYEIVSWVTQLVVHEDHRQKDVGKQLLFSIWGFSDHYAWGLLSANPYAIRALEKATRRRCVPVRIKKIHKQLFNFGVENVYYVDEEAEINVSKSASRINTNFFMDHSELQSMIDDVSKSAPWLLDTLDEGWEWFAFTFNDQKQISLTKDEIDNMLDASDQITKEAYSRMVLNKNHSWMQHTAKEVDLIMQYCNLDVKGQSVLDIGCGNGRHSKELASKGFNVTASDYNSYVSFDENCNVEFIEADNRSHKFNKKYDAIICLYDVIGSYADNNQNILLIENIAYHLKLHARTLISVMNFDATKRNSKNLFSLSNESNKLLKLPACNIMETTGNIFNPEYYMVESDTGVVYRKEQFTQSRELPTEFIVRDKRFTKIELESLLEDAGLKVIWSRYVKAGSWEKEHDKNSAKEILVLCEKIR